MCIYIFLNVGLQLDFWRFRLEDEWEPIGRWAQWPGCVEH